MYKKQIKSFKDSFLKTFVILIWLILYSLIGQAIYLGSYMTAEFDIVKGSFNGSLIFVIVILFIEGVWTKNKGDK
jgi:putative methionine-R-sulfoxide reductase with GAF domain